VPGYKHGLAEGHVPDRSLTLTCPREPPTFRLPGASLAAPLASCTPGLDLDIPQKNGNKFREDFLLTRKDTLRGGLPVQLETNSGPTLNFSRLRTLCVSPQAAIRVSTGTSVLP